MLMHQVDLGQLAPRVNIATWLRACTSRITASEALAAKVVSPPAATAIPFNWARRSLMLGAGHSEVASGRGRIR